MIEESDMVGSETTAKYTLRYWTFPYIPKYAENNFRKKGQNKHLHKTPINFKVGDRGEWHGRTGNYSKVYSTLLKLSLTYQKIQKTTSEQQSRQPHKTLMNRKLLTDDLEYLVHEKRRKRQAYNKTKSSLGYHSFTSINCNPRIHYLEYLVCREKKNTSLREKEIIFLLSFIHIH